MNENQTELCGIRPFRAGDGTAPGTAALGTLGPTESPRRMAMKRQFLPAALALSLFGIAAGVYTGYSWLWGTESEWRAAQDAAKRHDYTVADQHLRRYLAARPDKAEAHLLAAQVERRAILPV